MTSVDSILAIEQQGLEGDRYQRKTGYWDPVEGCQITVITRYDLQKASGRMDIDLTAGQHRRNLLLDGMHPKRLINQKIQIGDAVFEYHKPRPPCGYLDQLVRKGTAKALGKNSGFCFKVIRSGRISIGDEILFL